MYINLNFTKSFDIDTYISDLLELSDPNKTILKMTNIEKLNQHSKELIGVQADNSNNLKIIQQNSFHIYGR